MRSLNFIVRLRKNGTPHFSSIYTLKCPKKAKFSFTLGRSVECHQNIFFFLLSMNFIPIRCAKIFSSIFRGARKTLKNCANCTNFANSEIECEEWGEEKIDMRMKSSPPWPMRYEVRFLNFFSMRNEVRTSTKSKRIKTVNVMRNLSSQFIKNAFFN